MAIIRSSLSKIFQIEEGEGGTFALLSLSIFLAIGGTFVIGRTVSRSLFLSNLPPELISVRFIAVTIGVVLVSLIYTRYSVRFRRDKLILGSMALMAGGVLFYWLLLATPLGENLLILGGLFVFLEICATLTIIQFWTFASDLLNSREAKRLFSPIASMGSLGGIVASALVTVAAQALLAFGSGSCSILGEFLGDEDIDLMVRRRIPKVLGRITVPKSADILLQHLDEADNHTRARIYKALVRLQARGISIAASEVLLTARLQAELRLAFETSVTRIDLVHDIQGSLLADALAIRQRFAVDRIFYLLGLLVAGSQGFPI